jgi:hypothetical protein
LWRSAPTHIWTNRKVSKYFFGKRKEKKGGGDYTLSLIHKGEIATTINCHLTWDWARRDDKRHAKLKRATATLLIHLGESRYNNGLIAKLMLMWRREGRREMRAWLSCKHQAEHGSIGISGPK